jgi:hypothetical protein
MPLDRPVKSELLAASRAFHLIALDEPGALGVVIEEAEVIDVAALRAFHWYSAHDLSLILA